MSDFPSSVAGWQSWYDALVALMRTTNGRMSGEAIDAAVRDGQLDPRRFGPIYRAGDHDIGDMLVHPGCGHVYRLQRLVQLKVLRRRIMGQAPAQVFYYLPKATS
jgi:hypothetical protein